VCCSLVIRQSVVFVLFVISLAETWSSEKPSESDAEDDKKVTSKEQHSDNDDCSLEKLGRMVSMLH